MPQWRRTFYAIWFVQFIAVTGFAFIMPFIPLYIQELGITDIREVTLWAGLVTAAQAGSMAVMAPIWGALSDRYGRKPMVLRATYAGAVIMALMGFVTNVQQLLVLRLLQGLLTGTISAATTLVASTVPRDRTGMAMGAMQTATFLGVSFGPLIGGVLGDAFGYRPSFWITGGLLFLSAVVATIFVHEEFTPADDVVETGRRGFYGTAIKLVIGSSALMALFSARILIRMGVRTMGPVMPLFVQTLLPVGARIATITGLITAASAVGSAIGAPLIGRWGDRLGHRTLLIVCALGAGVFYVPQALVHDPWTLTILQVGAGFAIGGTLSSMTALLAQLAPDGHQGIVFGLDASAVASANATGPLIGAAIVAGLGLRAPFIAAAAVLVLGALTSLIWVRDGAAKPSYGEG